MLYILESSRQANVTSLRTIFKIFTIEISDFEALHGTPQSRVSTDLTEQISRRFPGYSRRDF